MPRIQLTEIECFDPVGTRDDVLLTLSSDEVSGQRIWGPERMRAGNRVNLTEQVGPILFDDFARLALYEYDRLGRNDLFGRIVLSPRDASFNGPHEHYFPGELNARYCVRYTYHAEPAAAPLGIIRPLRLTCNDAQGTRDRVSLEINDRIILGPRTFKTGWDVDFNDLTLSFYTTCEIRLRETRGQDWSRSVRLHRGVYDIGRNLEQVFAADRGIVGDARYTLRYRMEG